MRRIELTFILMLALAAAGCTAGPADPYARVPPTASHEATIDLDVNNVFAPPFGAVTDIHVRVTFEVMQGGPIDVWLAMADRCEAFGQAGFQAVDERLNVTSGVLVTDLAAGDNCVILDNTGMPMGEARPTGPVTVSYRIDVWERE